MLKKSSLFEKYSILPEVYKLDTNGQGLIIKKYKALTPDRKLWNLKKNEFIENLKMKNCGY